MEDILQAAPNTNIQNEHVSFSVEALFFEHEIIINNGFF